MYNIQDYYNDLKINGLVKTWEYILGNNIPLSSPDFQLSHLGELYEDGLARTNKIAKKEMGKYYTPMDVAQVMSIWFLSLPGDNICDVCCGVGNLILKVLELMPKETVINLIKSGHIYLYDIDPIAIMICRYTIQTLYGVEGINIIIGDFLSKDIHLPANAKVIANPPYGKITTINSHWEKNEIIEDGKDYYTAIWAKILKESIASCIITPHSFMYADKFMSFRLLMNNYGGNIYAFDNVPGNIFNGPKYGIFNTNNANSVRAAITLTDNKEKGYRSTCFIRFASAERNDVLNNKYLDSQLTSEIQIINADHPYYYRYFENEKLNTTWLTQTIKVENLLSSTPNIFKLEVPTTCRYFTVAAAKILHRSGKMIFYAKDADSFIQLYAIINSSFCYYYHRLCNGSITYPIGLLKNMPMILPNVQDLKPIVKKMLTNEGNYIIIKKNAGENQENIKFPEEWRNELNQVYCKTLGCDYKQEFFDQIHSNSKV